MRSAVACTFLSHSSNVSAGADTGDVAVDEPPGDGVIERSADDGVDLEDGLGRAAGAASAAGGGERVVKGVEVIGAQATERDATDGGLDVTVDEPRVPVRGGGTDLAALVRDPGVGQELTERDRAGRRCRCGVAFTVEASGELFGFVAVVADGGAIVGVRVR